MKNMFLHDLKVACRSLLKYKLQTVISVVGLAVGLTCFVVCNVKLRDELMRDRRLPNAENIYFIDSRFNDEPVWRSKKIMQEIRDKFPEVEKTIHFLHDESFNVSKICVVENEQGKRWREESFIYSDSAFMDFFDIDLLAGNLDVIKQQADAMILTKSAAIRIFGTIDVVGRTFMDIDDSKAREIECKVAGLIADFPLQTRFEDRAGVILNTTDREILKHPLFYISQTLFRINENVSIDDLNKKIDNFIKTNPDLFEKSLTSLKFRQINELVTYYYSEGAYLTYLAIPLIMSGVGLLVLLTAIFNYVIFMSGRILNRQKEYGLRQITGANSISIFRMFAVEITLSICMVVFISLMLIEILTRVLTEDISSYISFDDKLNWLLILGGYLLEYAVLVCGVMMGICWLILKRFRILTTLQHIQSGGVRYKNRLSNLLLGIQFTICVLLGGGAFFLYAQQEFLVELFRGKLSIEECKRIYGFSFEGDRLKPIAVDFQNVINANPYIECSCRSGNDLLRPWFMSSKDLKLEGINNQSNEDITGDLHYMIVDANYSEFINTRMEEGRFFRKDEPYCAVVNREFVRHFGINPLGKNMVVRDRPKDGWNTFHIVGIMEDMLPAYQNNELKPCIYLPYPDGYHDLTYYVKLFPNAKPEALEPLKAKMREQLHISTPLGIETLEEELGSSFEDIQEMSNLLSLFASICISICLLGIYSSMMLAVEKRGREMAIRKINGARLVDIARIFVSHYFVLLGVAALIAFPALYLGVQTWLESYTYRVPISVLPFIAIFVLLFAIVLLTIGSQLIKIMRINPVEKLKSE